MPCNNSPIGVFDSGIGGLTVLKEIKKMMPDERVIYFGDTARVPYGNKSRSTVLRYVGQIIRFLRTKDVKAIVIACNTASAYAIGEYDRNSSPPVLGVIEAGVEAAAFATKTKQIAVLGTDGTIGSSVHKNMLEKIDPDIRTFGMPCPLFVPLAEEGLFDDEITDSVVKRYLSRFKGSEVDTLILGCTHYPLLEGAMRRYLGDDIRFIDPAFETAGRLKALLTERNMLCDGKCIEADEYYVSDSAKKMIEFANLILGGSKKDIRLLNIDNY